MKRHERACAYVNLDAIIGNLEQMKQNLSGEAKIVAVIKTDGYGHGAVPIARELEKIPYIFGYATATAEESFALRHNGIKKPILCLGYTFPESYEKLVIQDIRPALFREDQAKQFSEAAVKAGKTVKVHVKVDTGMSRIGIAPDSTGVDFIKMVMGLPNVEVEGIFTHFSRADEADKLAAEEQLGRYKEFLELVDKQCSKKIPFRHISNSAGIIEMPYAHMDLVRAGIILYGLWPSNEVVRDKVYLTPALSLKSHVVYVKEIKKGTPVSYGGTYVADCNRKIATIPLGYGDGYPRSLSNKGYVLIRGQKAPIVGRVCMDQFMVDVTDIPGVICGDEVTLIGTDGKHTLTMEQLGEMSGRFNYEFACDLSKRIPRVFTKGGKVIDTIEYIG
ncbi:MAG: alanine racemase [Lachnospiraceae bacterium]|nr:alanine racemase [Lachnospiraceae bacterium]